MRRAAWPYTIVQWRILLLAFVSGLNVAAASAQIPNKDALKIADSSTTRNDRSKNTGPALSDREWLREIQMRVDEVDLRLANLTLQYQLIRDSLALAERTRSSLVSGENGFALQSANKTYQLRIGGYLQADGRAYLSQAGTPAKSALLLRRARPIIEVTLHDRFGLRLMTDFGEGKVVLYDGYSEARLWPAFVIRAGKFKPPIGLERLQSAADLRFVERGLPTNLVPNRDVGVQLSGEVAGGVLSYQIGAFNGVPDLGIGDTDSQNSKDLIGRIFFSPFRYAGPALFRNLGLGIAASDGNELGSLTLPALATYRTPGQMALFQYRADGTAANTVIAAGRRVRISPQSYLNVGALGLLAEFVRSSQYVSRGASVAHLSHDAWQVAGSWLATGEKNSYKSVTPRRSFDPPAGAWGAVEITGRYGSLDLDPAAFPIYADPAVAARSARTVGVGISWYLASTIKFIADYDRTQFVGGGVGGNRAAERFVSTRFQTGF